MKASLTGQTLAFLAFPVLYWNRNKTSCLGCLEVVLLKAGTEIIFTATRYLLFNLFLGFNSCELAKMPMHFRLLRSKADGLYFLKLEARDNLKGLLCEDPPVWVAVVA